MEQYIDYIMVWENGCLAPLYLPKRAVVSLLMIEFAKSLERRLLDERDVPQVR